MGRGYIDRHRERARRWFGSWENGEFSWEHIEFELLEGSRTEKSKKQLDTQVWTQERGADWHRNVSGSQDYGD